MKSRRTPPSRCTNCGKPTDAATAADLGGRMPKPGDLGVCFYCGHVMIYRADLTLGDPGDADILRWAGDPRLLDVQRVLGLRKKKP